VCRAARSDVEIAGQFRHFLQQPGEPTLLPAGNARLAVILGRTADFVGARKAFYVGAVFGQLRQPMREIFEIIGDDVDDAGF
jgi:hypothetical protein